MGDSVEICAVLKAQCYGLGGVQAGVLMDGLGADSFAVAVLSEAMELREKIPDKEILILGYVSERGYDMAIEHGITLTMYREDAMRKLNQRAGELGSKALVHIKINSGMNRVGFMPTQSEADTVLRCMRLPNLQITGIFTHLATADEADKSGAHMQMRRFDAFLEMLRRRGAEIPKVHVRQAPPSAIYRNMTGTWSVPVCCSQATIHRRTSSGRAFICSPASS